MVCCAGKTHLGMRLAQLYGLLHVNTAIILAELQHMDPETQKVGTCNAYRYSTRIPNPAINTTLFLLIELEARLQLATYH